MEPFVPGPGSVFGTGDPLWDMWLRPNPGLTEVADIFAYALTVDGYEYAKMVLACDLREQARSLQRKWAGPRRTAMTFVELRLLLFWFQRAARHVWQGGSLVVRRDDGTEKAISLKAGPDGGDKRRLYELNQAICEAWEREWPLQQGEDAADREAPREAEQTPAGSTRVLRLDGGRVIRLSSLNQHHTYGGLLLGYPTSASNQRMLKALIASHRQTDSSAEPYLIEPLEKPLDVAPDPRRHREPGAVLSAITCVAEFTSGPLERNVDDDCSGLVVIWLQDEFAFPIDPLVLSRILAIDWEARAAGQKF